MGTQPALTPLNLAINSTDLPLNVSLRDAKPVRKVTRDDLPRLFDEVFYERPALRSEDVQQAFRLRYQVYCLDKGFEPPAAGMGGIEKDDFDAHASHSLLIDRTREKAVGTVRMVRPSDGPNWFRRLPLSAYASEQNLNQLAHLPSDSTAEISRFAILRPDMPNILAERACGAPTKGPVAKPLRWRRKLLPYMSLGLIRGMLRMSIEAGVTHLCMAAEPSLLRRLRGFGLEFTDCGPPVEHRGVRQICHWEIKSMEEKAASERPDVWEIVTRGGLLRPRTPAQ